MVEWGAGFAIRTEIRQLAEGGHDVELEDVVPESPVVSHVRIPLGHDAFDAEGLEPSSQGNGTRWWLMVSV